MLIQSQHKRRSVAAPLVSLAADLRLVHVSLFSQHSLVIEVGGELG